LKLGNTLKSLEGPVLITGHTGFKGTWLSLLLEKLNVPIIGYSLAPKKNSLYKRLERGGKITELYADIRSRENLLNFIKLHQPSVVVHLAAQPLVLQSYKSPLETFDTNVMGTANVLSSAFETESIKAIAVITTDKVYRNHNHGSRFRETDPLEGKDPYSASKVGAEAVVSAWQQIAAVSGGPKLMSVRAGNVIGGGDFAENRLIPDLIRGLIASEEVLIRNPLSTRPWQHALDPLAGYVMALEHSLIGSGALSFNFGPVEQSLPVGEVVKICKNILNINVREVAMNAPKAHLESVNLDLDSSLANKILNWRPQWTQHEAIELTANWWQRVVVKQESPSFACDFDVEDLLSSTKKG
jgi:CDP-glucose 4,6-dehydratase